MRTVTHLTASTFYGGPERQMLGLAQAISADWRTSFLSFSERGQCDRFLQQARLEGFAADALRHDTPNFRGAVREIARRLADLSAEIVCVHGYKAGLLGRIAARRVGVPVIAVSRGWTYEDAKVRFYEFLDRVNLRFMDRVVCVSHCQAETVRKAGVPAGRILVIPNAIRGDRYENPLPCARRELGEFFPRPPRYVVGAAGRLSPEKGFEVLIDSAALIVKQMPDVGFALFGEGARREALCRRIAAQALTNQFVLLGHRSDLDRFMPWFDAFVQSSYTEGMPNVVLEACAAGVPVVATAVGGTPEIIEDGVSGCLVPAGDPAQLARRLISLLGDDERRRSLSCQGRQRVREQFVFEAQARSYAGLFGSLGGRAMTFAAASEQGPAVET
jgi:glycosyltransferase involved in cell wall biosynthesis